MITRKVIESLYKKYDKVPPSPDCLDIPLLFESAYPHGTAHHHGAHEVYFQKIKM